MTRAKAIKKSIVTKNEDAIRKIYKILVEKEGLTLGDIEFEFMSYGMDLDEFRKIINV